MKKNQQTPNASFLAAIFCSLILSSVASAQFAVTTNSGSGLAATYPSLAAAVSALNAATITSPVVITCPTGTKLLLRVATSITRAGHLDQYHYHSGKRGGQQHRHRGRGYIDHYRRHF